MQTTNDELIMELYKTIKPEDVKKASDDGDLIAYFGGIVRKIFPKTTSEWKEKEEKKEPKKRIRESELDSVRIGEF